MDNDHLYLTPGLSVDSVAKEIGTNRAYISRLLNRTYNSSFPEFVNNKRIKYAKQLLQDEPDAVLEYVAIKSGFSTLSQFTRKFKEITGQSPRQWQKSNKKIIRPL
jgi:AraC-like DNA-binding protein